MNKRVSIVIPEEDLAAKFLEACQIIYSMRKYKKIWDEHYGAQNRSNLQLWEDNADKFLKSLTIKKQEDAI